MTVREWYEDAIKFGEPLLANVILILVSKQVLKWTDGEERLKHCLNPAPEKRDAVNAFFRRELTKMSGERRTA